MDYLDNIDKIFFICISENFHHTAKMKSMINRLFNTDKVEIRWTSNNKLIYNFNDQIRNILNTNIYDKEYLYNGEDEIYNYIYNHTYNHYDIIKSAYYRDYNRIIICEDTFGVPSHCYHIFKNALNNLPDHGDIIMMNYNLKTILGDDVNDYNNYSTYDTNINNYFYKVTNLVDRCYEYSKCYILSRTGMERMIQYFENTLLPIESYFNIAYNDLFYNDLKYGLINYYIFKHKNIII